MKEQIRQIFIDHFLAVRGFAVKLCKDRQLGHDIAMDSFFKMIDAMQAGLQIKNPKAYLNTCVKHRYLDLKAHKVVEEKYKTWYLTITDNAELFAVDTRDRDQILKIFLPQLTERYQQIIYGTMQNKSTEELARECKIQPVTVRRLRLMAIEKLKQLISVGKYEM